MTDTTPELLERYLGAVGALLPGKQRPDILAEIKDALLSRLEERQKELGRALTPQETEDVLKAYGHPMVVAAPYRDREQRPLIGPELLPWYGLFLRVVLAIVWIGDLVHGGIALASGQSPLTALGQLVQGLLSSAVQVTGTLTIIAVLLERFGIGALMRQGSQQIVSTWRPRDLPRPLPPTPAATPGLVFTWDLIGVGLAALWVSGALDAMLSPALTHLEPTAFALTLRWPLLAITVALTGLHGMAALKWQPTLRAVLSVILNAVVLILLVTLLLHWPLFQVVGLAPDTAAQVAHGVNVGLGISWAVLALLALGGLLWDLAALRGGPKPPADAALEGGQTAR